MILDRKREIKRGWVDGVDGTDDDMCALQFRFLYDRLLIIITVLTRALVSWCGNSRIRGSTEDVERSGVITIRDTVTSLIFHFAVPFFIVLFSINQSLILMAFYIFWSTRKAPNSRTLSDN